MEYDLTRFLALTIDERVVEEERVMEETSQFPRIELRQWLTCEKTFRLYINGECVDVMVELGKIDETIRGVLND